MATVIIPVRLKLICKPVLWRVRMVMPLLWLAALISGAKVEINMDASAGDLVADD